VPRSRMPAAVPPLLQHAFMAWCLVKKKADRQLYLYFTSLYNNWNISFF